MRIGYSVNGVDDALEYEDVSCKCNIVSRVRELIKRKDITVIKIELI